MKKTGIIWSDRFTKYNLGEGHPMNARRLDIPYQLYKNLDFHDNHSIVDFTPVEASEDDLLGYHSKNYIKMVKSLSKAGDGYYGRYGLGTGDCPVFPEMHESSCLIVGGTLMGTDLIMNDEVDQAFSLMAGLHHAFEERAAGFCYYNDAVIAIKHLQEVYGIDRVLYIDTDVHHGDGVLSAFYSSKNVLGLSIHESPQFLFPGTGLSDEIGKEEGLGYTINIPLFPGTWDDLYMDLFESIIPCIWKEYDPEFIVWQCGADGHFGDILGHLNLTTNLYNYLGKRISELSDDCSANGRLLLLGGGGYNPDSVARVWMTILAGISGISLPEFAPQEWIDYCKKTYQIDVSTKLTDDKLDPLKIERHSLINEANSQYLQVLKEELQEVGVWNQCTENI